MRAKKLPEGWERQSFRFALDTRPSQRVLLERHFGMRRKAHNWAVAQCRRHVSDFVSWREAFAAGDTTEQPPDGTISLASLRARWNAHKPALCRDGDGRQWWRDLSKEAASSGIADAADAYWRHMKSDTDMHGRRLVGFPRFKRKGRDRDRYRVTTGAYGPDGDRHVKIPRVGRVRTHESMRDLARLVKAGRAKIGAMTVAREGKRLFVSFAVAVRRPQQPRLRGPERRSVVGVDAGVHCLAVVAAADGTIVERVENPKPLEAALKQLRRLQRSQSRGQKGSRHSRIRTAQISELHARVKRIRTHAWHDLTTRLAKTHDLIVVEDLAVAQMGQQKNLPGARKRRRRLYDAAMGTLKRHMSYKTRWHGSELILADRWYPSSKTCHKCGHWQDIGWAREWTCHACGAVHDRDENAAVNLALYPSGAQQSCGCADCETLRVEQSKRLSRTPTRPGHSSDPVAVPAVMREVVQPKLGDNPETG